MKLDLLDNTKFKKVLGFVSVALAAATAVLGTISDQKKEAEHEQLMKDVAELKNNR